MATKIKPAPLDKQCLWKSMAFIENFENYLLYQHQISWLLGTCDGYCRGENNNGNLQCSCESPCLDSNACCEDYQEECVSNPIGQHAFT